MGELAALASAALWAAASLMFQRLGKRVPPLALNFLKGLLALGMMALAAQLIQGRLWPAQLPPKALLLLGTSALVGLALGDTLYFEAMGRIGVRRALLFSALTPPMTALLAWPLLGEGLGAMAVVGMVLTMGGVTWVILERTPQTLASPLADTPPKAHAKVLGAGVALALGAALCQALGNVLTKAGGQGLSALDISVVRLSLGTAMLWAMLLLKGQGRGLWRPLTAPRSAALLVGATFLGTFLGIWLKVTGLNLTSAAVAATLSSTSPVFILPLVYLTDGERLSMRAVAGALVAVGGVALLFVG